MHNVLNGAAGFCFHLNPNLFLHPTPSHHHLHPSAPSETSVSRYSPRSCWLLPLPHFSFSLPLQRRSSRGPESSPDENGRPSSVLSLADFSAAFVQVGGTCCLKLSSAQQETALFSGGRSAARAGSADSPSHASSWPLRLVLRCYFHLRPLAWAISSSSMASNTICVPTAPSACLRSGHSLGSFRPGCASI